MANIRFIEEGHIYLLDETYVLPSVSEILKFIFHDKYKGIDKEILNRKADFGTKVHRVIELSEQSSPISPTNSFASVNDEIYKEFAELLKNMYVEASFNQYKKLVKKYNIEVLEQEQIVSYENIFAGRLDMIGNVDGCYSLLDIKTTADLDKEYLSWQLSLYELALGKQFEKLYCIWLPKKELGQLVEIERINKIDLVNKIEEFKKHRDMEVKNEYS